MGLFEWIGESFNPGPIGSMDIGAKNRTFRTNGVVLLRLFFALILIGAVYYLTFSGFYELTIKNATIVSGILLAYLIIGYFVRPEPDTSNLGWLGGLMNNPFRFSDDINRFLIFLKIALLPGSFLAESLLDGLQLLCRR